MRRSVYFTRPRTVEVFGEEAPRPGPRDLLVRTTLSGISAGTELLFYRRQIDEGTKLDTSIPSLGGRCEYPFKYGYSAVGEVVEAGGDAPQDLIGSRVFSFHCHESMFALPAEEAMVVPPGVSDEDALFLPSMETALSLVMDSAPIMGEDVIVLGQGVIGLLTTSLLAMIPLSSLTTADRFPLRRSASLELGADRSLDPSLSPQDFLRDAGLGEGRADLAFELSGDPRALEFATHVVGLEGRVVVGSWYGNKEATLCFGEDFHRNRLRIFSSQVSRVAGALSARWSKQRRLELAWRMVRRARPSRLITHRFKIADAPAAYRLLDEDGEGAIQVVLVYPEGS